MLPHHFLGNSTHSLMDRRSRASASDSARLPPEPVSPEHRPPQWAPVHLPTLPNWTDSGSERCAPSWRGLCCPESSCRAAGGWGACRCPWEEPCAHFTGPSFAAGFGALHVSPSGGHSLGDPSELGWARPSWDHFLFFFPFPLPYPWDSGVLIGFFLSTFRGPSSALRTGSYDNQGESLTPVPRVEKSGTPFYTPGEGVCGI